MNMILMSSTSITIIAVASVLFVLGLACLIYKIAVKLREKKTGIQQIDGTRYTTSSEEKKEDGSISVTVNSSDVILLQDKDYVVSPDGELKPGKYTVLSPNEGVSTVNLRIGHNVRNYKHGSSIVLVEGEKVSAVSSSVILR